MIKLIASSNTSVGGRGTRARDEAIVAMESEHDPDRMLSNDAIAIPPGVHKVELTVSLVWGAQYPAGASIIVYRNGTDAAGFTAPAVQSAPERGEVSCVLYVNPGDKLVLFVSAESASGKNYISDAVVQVAGVRLEVLG